MVSFESLLGSAVSVMALSLNAPAMETVSPQPVVLAASQEISTQSDRRPAVETQAAETVQMAMTQEQAPDSADEMLVQSDVAPPSFEGTQQASDEQASDEQASAEQAEAGMETLEAAPFDTPVFADLSDEQVFAKVADYLESIDTYSAHFIQTAASGIVQAGELKLDRPGKLRVDYEPPSPQLIVATQGMVYINDSDLETTDSYPVKRTPLRFLLEDRLNREEVNLTSVVRTGSSVMISITSRDEETDGELFLVFEAPELLLRKWVVIDPAGEQTTLELDSIRVGEKISANEFRVPKAGGSFIRDR